MLQLGVEANTIRYNTVIRASAERRNAARAEHWLSAVKTVTTSYSIVVTACAETCNNARAEH